MCHHTYRIFFTSPPLGTSLLPEAGVSKQSRQEVDCNVLAGKSVEKKGMDPHKLNSSVHNPKKTFYKHLPKRAHNNTTHTGRTLENDICLSKTAGVETFLSYTHDVTSETGCYLHAHTLQAHIWKGQQ